MKLHLLIFLAALTVGYRTTGQQYDSTYGKPLIILIETNPWLMVIGSDIPSFALYEKGQVIYKSIEDNKLKIYQVTLTQEELQKVVTSFSISDDIYKLQDNIEASGSTDQPSNILKLNLSNPKRISVYGRLGVNGEAREKTPKEFLTVYDNIKNYRNSATKEWLPQMFEVMFWDYNYAPNKRSWIKGFPDLKSPSTTKFGDDSYSVFIDKSKFDEFEKFYSSLGEKEAVEINGRKMAISFRFPFPNIQ